MDARPLMSGGPEEARGRGERRGPVAPVGGCRGLWLTDVNLSVKASGSHQRRVQNVRSVGSRQDHYVSGRVETCQKETSEALD